MPRIKGTTDAQTKFLRSFRDSQFGPAMEDWPSPAILRRWLRRPGFYRALLDLKKVLMFQSDFQLLSAAASASHLLHSTVTTGSDEALQAKQILTFASLLKLTHLRQRFAPTERKRDIEKEELPRLIHPNVSDERAEQIFKEMREDRIQYEAWLEQRALESESAQSGIQTSRP